jgi:hypothetical protein
MPRPRVAGGAMSMPTLLSFRSRFSLLFPFFLLSCFCLSDGELLRDEAYHCRRCCFLTLIMSRFGRTLWQFRSTLRHPRSQWHLFPTLWLSSEMPESRNSRWTHGFGWTRRVAVDYFPLLRHPSFYHAVIMSEHLLYLPRWSYGLWLSTVTRSSRQKKVRKEKKKKGDNQALVSKPLWSVKTQWEKRRHTRGKPPCRTVSTSLIILWHIKVREKLSKQMEGINWMIQRWY